jgi:hypothetical protein
MRTPRPGRECTARAATRAVVHAAVPAGPRTGAGSVGGRARPGRAARRAVLACLAVLAACGGSGSALTAAPRAADPACVRALAQLPTTVLGSSRTALAVAGAASFGQPSIVLRCGLPEQPPTTKPCLTVNGVDWVVDDAADPIVFTTYGRVPAAEVRVPLADGRENAPAALVDLAAVARALPTTTHHCIGN